MKRLIARRSGCAGLLALLTALPWPLLAAEKEVRLSEPAEKSSVSRVKTELEIDGELKTAVGADKAASLPLDGEASFLYRQRRLPAAGLQAAALRSLREYLQAEATIEVKKQATRSRLRENRRLIVAHGRNGGPLLYSPDGLLRPRELELLQTPGDSLSLLGLLPDRRVTLGEKWNPEQWAVSMLTGVEAVSASEMRCELVSLKEQTAKVEFNGEIEGAAEGAATSLKISGHYEYDLQQRLITRLEMEQHEERSIGAVSPGMNVVAKVTMTRQPARNPGQLTDTRAANIPETPTSEQLHLVLEPPWNIRLRFGRHWHVFHRQGKRAVLRLLKQGRLIAQCNISKIPDAPPGDHTSKEQFRRDIRTTLSDRLKSIDEAEQLETGSERFVYRVTAVGEANGRSMLWIYYLCANPDGRQLSLVFAVEESLLEDLAEQDRQIIENLQFLKTTTE